MLSSSPIEAEASPDWRLAGLLTYTSTKPSKVRLSRSRALINLCSLLCAHNCGVEADSLRASQKAQVANLYRAAPGADPNSVLAQAVAVLREEKVHAILHVGDLIEANGVQSESEYEKKFDSATQILDQSRVPWFLTPGDHDVVPDLDMNDWTREATDHTREEYFLKFYAAKKPQLKPKSLFYSFDLDGYHFVALYSIET